MNNRQQNNQQQENRLHTFVDLCDQLKAGVVVMRVTGLGILACFLVPLINELNYKTLPIFLKLLLLIFLIAPTIYYFIFYLPLLMIELRNELFKFVNIADDEKDN